MGPIMIYSHTIKYALNTLVYLAEQPPEARNDVNQIAGALGIPKHYLGKILQDLRKQEIVESHRGRLGGFRLLRSPEDIGLYNVVSGIEDPRQYEMCIFDELECNRGRPCSAVCGWNRVKNCITEFMQNHSLADLQKVWQFRKGPEFNTNSQEQSL